MSESNTISYEAFSQLDMRIGTVLTAEHIPDADKLLLLSVDLGEDSPRQIVSGIAPYVEAPDELVGRKLPFIANLAPRIIFGYESQGMLLAMSTKEGSFSFLVPDRDVPAGTKLG